MKYYLFLILIFSVVIGCAHSNKKTKDTYQPVVSFEEAAKNYSAKVNLPKNKFTGKVPLVVIVHEWWGRTPYVEKRGEMLNQEGYATLVVDLYGNNELALTPKDAQGMATPFYQEANKGITLLEKYIKEAKKNPHVDAEKIFVIGYCFGGTQALNLARSGADIKGVVSFHGGLLPGLKAENVKAKILAINGLADPMVPAKERAAFDREMKSLKTTFKVVNYKGATHAFSNPDATAIGKKYNIPIAYNKVADEGSWKDLLEFLKN